MKIYWIYVASHIKILTNCQNPYRLTPCKIFKFSSIAVTWPSIWLVTSAARLYVKLVGSQSKYFLYHYILACGFTPYLPRSLREPRAGHVKQSRYCNYSYIHRERRRNGSKKRARPQAKGPVHDRRSAWLKSQEGLHMVHHPCCPRSSPSPPLSTHTPTTHPDPDLLTSPRFAQFPQYTLLPSTLPSTHNQTWYGPGFVPPSTEPAYWWIRRPNQVSPGLQVALLVLRWVQIVATLRPHFAAHRKPSALLFSPLTCLILSEREHTVWEWMGKAQQHRHSALRNGIWRGIVDDTVLIIL